MIAEAIFVAGKRIHSGIIIDERIPPPIEEIVDFARKMGAMYYLGKTEIFVVRFKHFGNTLTRVNYYALEDKIEATRCLRG